MNTCTFFSLTHIGDREGILMYFFGTVNADVVLKGTTADDVYDCNSRNSNNVAFEHISFRELVSRGFTAIDVTAITFCEENNIPGYFLPSYYASYSYFLRILPSVVLFLSCSCSL